MPKRSASRAHSRHRWENQPAIDVRLEDLDREEILRTRQAAIERRRISADTGMDVGDILDRLAARGRELPPPQTSPETAGHSRPYRCRHLSAVNSHA